MKTIIEKNEIGETIRTIDVTGKRKIKEIDGRRIGLDPVGHIQYWSNGICVGSVPIMRAGWVSDKTVIATGNAYYTDFDCAHICQDTIVSSRLTSYKK